MHQLDDFFMQKLNLDNIFVFMWLSLLLLVLLLRAMEIHEMQASWDDWEREREIFCGFLFVMS